MPKRSLTWFVSIGAVALVAWAASAASGRGQADIYSVHSAGVGLGGGARAGNGRVAGQRLGAQRGADDAVVDVQQRLEHLDALQRRRCEVGAHGHGAGRVRRAPCSTATPRRFVVSQSGKSGAARFLFATEGGTIMGWSPTVNGTVAVVGADRSRRARSTRASRSPNDKLYATDFHNGRVDVFDPSFNLVPGGFTDPKIPKGFAPFGIQALGGNIFVTYAKQDAAKKDDVAAARPGIRRRVHPGRRADRTGRQLEQDKRAAERGLGPRSRTGRLRRLRRRPARRELRQRPDQRVHPARREVGLQGPAAPRRRQPDRDRRALGDRVRQRLRRRADEHALLPLRSLGQEAHGLFGSITAG